MSLIYLVIYYLLFAFNRIRIILDPLYKIPSLTFPIRDTGVTGQYIRRAP